MFLHIHLNTYQLNSQIPININSLGYGETLSCIYVHLHDRVSLTNLKIRIIETVHNIPAQHKKFFSFKENTVKETKSKKKFLVLVLFLSSSELLFGNKLIKSFHVRLQALESIPRKSLVPLTNICTKMSIHVNMN